MTAALVLAGGLILTRVRSRHLVLGAGAVLVAVNLPLLVVPLLLGSLGVVTRGRLRHKSASRHKERADAATLAELTAIALTGGMGVQPALTMAARTLGGSVGVEAMALLRQMRVDGVDVLRTAGGSAGDLYRTLGRAAVTGASLLDSVIRLADELHATQAADRLEAARRLPVAMLFPLTLLILPGFLLLTVAPALLDGLGRLEI